MMIETQRETGNKKQWSLDRTMWEGEAMAVGKKIAT